ncbi:nitrate- and nitrite sensing domain-containing protein [Emcibacteraceae bacterium Y4]|nr:nitrate- and nitrite sensing domain-containing protein [Pseudemcibacter aquimaris]MCC3859655.1 nitrate- and nitrite sensing domain-containing protein [Pseudemcibacter aquimaris]WDU60050.1 nitrate- and nitrite sensing domain-containing protein [Pseudemcibacter aquimaris]
MTDFLNRFTIGSRINSLMGVLLISLVAFAAAMLMQLSTTKTEMEDLSTLAEFTPYVGSVIHELQKERGASAGYIGSSGASQFATNLNTQKGSTDTVIQGFKAAAANFPVERFDENLSILLNNVQANLNKLSDVRNDVSELNASTPEMARYYTGTINSALSVIKEAAQLTTDYEMLNSIVVYTSLLEAKEIAGLERAAGTGSYAAGRFNDVALANLISLIAKQDAFMTSFNSFASQEVKDFYAQTVVGQELDRHNELREYATSSPDDLSGSGASGTTEWFSVMTAKINKIKVVEDKISTDLIEQSSSASADASTSFWFGVVALIVLVGISIVFSVIIASSIVSPLRNLRKRMQAVAKGELDLDIPYMHFKNEIGNMANALNHFKESALENIRMTEEAEKNERRAAEEKEKRRLEAEELEKQQARDKEEQERQAQEAQYQNRLELAQSFEDRVVGILDSLSGSTENLNVISKNMTKVADDTQDKSMAASSATRQAGANVQAVASASEEMSASIAEITRQVSESTGIANNAVKTAESALTRVNKLTETSERIGEVVQLINDIAEQTNLLALNATIESARAGEAGKGFAVVANEVKSLATQTGNATDEIRTQITEMQDATKGAVTAVNEITSIINQINDISLSIESSVEEQSSATNEISQNAIQAATGADEVGRNINDVSQSASETGEAAQTVLGASEDFAEQTKVLRNEVDSFLSEVRSK